MNSDLFKAILALDSYNRGYGASIKFGNLSGNNSVDAPETPIGNATIFRANGDLTAQSIGFYGIAYDYAGEKVVSFRGTDDPLGASFGSDIWNGWSGGLGIGLASQQATLALMHNLSF